MSITKSGSMGIIETFGIDVGDRVYFVVYSPIGLL
jgi:hypothetical protein